ncbi:MAG: type II 3-dehydroquinate dehydratase [Pseudomonadales bacterium]|jgi:3-dehydroquinate dehydratase-2
MAKIIVLHGPNLNLLGSREPEVYGTDTLEDINARLRAQVEGNNHEFEAFQSNAEHELINKIHDSKESASFIVINPGAFTHTSIALRDALLGVSIPFVEIHLSNVHSREQFRQHSYLSDVAVGVITGLGAKGYEMAVDYALSRI